MVNPASVEREHCRSRAHATHAAATLALAALTAARVIFTGPVGGLLAVGGGAGLSYFFLHKRYRDALDRCDNISPLILDLDGDGIEADALTHFDHEGDGWSELSRWANEDDGVFSSIFAQKPILSILG